MEDKRAVSKADGEQFAKDLGIKYFEVSAKMNIGLDECFGDVFETSYVNKYCGHLKRERIESVKLSQPKNNLKPGEAKPKDQKKKGCAC